MSRKSMHILRLSLQDDPSIYREVEVPSGASLYDLADYIVSAFDFDFDHAFGFYSDLGHNFLRSQPKYELFADMGEGYDAFSVRATRISEAFAEIGQAMLFVFDYGDDWRFKVEVIGWGECQTKVRYPRPLKSVGHAPEQYPEQEDNEEDGPEDRPRAAH